MLRCISMNGEKSIKLQDITLAYPVLGNTFVNTNAALTSLAIDGYLTDIRNLGAFDRDSIEQRMKMCG
jgi:hypothetical protein